MGEELSSCVWETEAVVWLAHIVRFVLGDSSRSASVVLMLHSYCLSQPRERPSLVVPDGLTYEKVQRSRIELIEGAVGLQRCAALLAVHLENNQVVLRNLPIAAA